MMHGETLEDACKRVQRYHDGAGEREPWLDGETDRKRVFAQAIRRGVSYRRLAKAVGLTPGVVHALLYDEDTARVDPFTQFLDQP